MTNEVELREALVIEVARILCERLKLPINTQSPAASPPVADSLTPPSESRWSQVAYDLLHSLDNWSPMSTPDWRAVTAALEAAAATAPGETELLAPDRPEYDATDAAHPAWWRGHDNGCKGAIELVRKRTREITECLAEDLIGRSLAGLLDMLELEVTCEYERAETAEALLRERQAVCEELQEANNAQAALLREREGEGEALTEVIAAARRMADWINLMLPPQGSDLRISPEDSAMLKAAAATVFYKGHLALRAQPAKTPGPSPGATDSDQHRGISDVDKPSPAPRASIEGEATPSNPTGSTAGNVTTPHDATGSAPCDVGPDAGRATPAAATVGKAVAQRINALVAPAAATREEAWVPKVGDRVRVVISKHIHPSWREHVFEVIDTDNTGATVKHPDGRRIRWDNNQLEPAQPAPVEADRPVMLGELAEALKQAAYSNGIPAFRNVAERLLSDAAKGGK